MSSALNTNPTAARRFVPESKETFVTFTVNNQLFGIPVEQVQDVLMPDVIAPVPLSPPEISGSINLRGRIVTVIDVRKRLALPPRPATDTRRRMGVTIESGSEFFSLLVDAVGDIMTLTELVHEDNPATLDPLWRDIAKGVYRIDGGLLVALDIERLLDIPAKS
jgi:purine-binding chemotaxis protein CheW